jgi:hypothetical protein
MTYLLSRLRINAPAFVATIERALGGNVDPDPR